MRNALWSAASSEYGSPLYYAVFLNSSENPIASKISQANTKAVLLPQARDTHRTPKELVRPLAGFAQVILQLLSKTYFYLRKLWSAASSEYGSPLFFVVFLRFWGIL
jgi:hypothetical protein